MYYLDRNRTLWQRECRLYDSPQDQRGARLMHNITDVRNDRRMVRMRSSVMVRGRAGMVMVCIRRRRGVKHPGGNTERCQQQEHTIDDAQAQGAHTVPISVF